MRTKRGARPRGLNQSGNAAILFAMCLLPILIIVGGALDFSERRSRASSVQHALDMASLAAARHLSNTPAATDPELIDLAQGFFNAELVGVEDIQLESLQMRRLAGTLQFSVDGFMPTSLLHLIGQDTLPLDTDSFVTYTFLPEIELAIVIDNSGSMSGAKIAAVQTAAKQLVNRILVPGSDRVQIAVVPFAEYVSVGTGFGTEDWIDVSTPTTAPRALRTTWNGCVRHRVFPHHISDEDYVAFPVRAFTSLEERCPTPITPLTSDEDTLTDAIDAMTTGSGFHGKTFFFDAITWGLRVLSPDEPYAEGRAFDEMARIGGRKAMLFLSDGGINTGSNFHGWIQSYTSTLGLTESREFSRDACTQIKDNDIQIFTIAYEFSGSYATAARDFMRNCASSPAHFFDAADSDDLIDAFDAIANSFGRDIAIAG